jgi:hypothetical protein
MVIATTDFVHRMRRMAEWIPCANQLPAIDQTVDVLYVGGATYEAERRNSPEGWEWYSPDADEPLPAPHVTHWRSRDT